MPARMTQQEFEQRVKKYTNDSVDVIGTYFNKRTKVLIKCKTCGYEWDFSPSNIMPSSANQYSFIGCPKCKYTTLKCDYCGKEFERLKSDLNDSKSGLHFCSKECGNRYKNDLVKNTINSSDYRRNAFEHYEHKCAICGYDEDERVLEVHHIDENRQNNHIDNLIILCPICHKKLTLHLYTLNELKNI